MKMEYTSQHQEFSTENLHLCNGEQTIRDFFLSPIVMSSYKDAKGRSEPNILSASRYSSFYDVTMNYTNVKFQISNSK